MTAIITAAVRAGCETFYPKACLYPDCACPNRRGDDRHGLETAARHAAEAMREKAALLVGASLSSPINANRDEWLAKQIRAIPTGDETP